jgi:hypothetical protein
VRKEAKVARKGPSRASPTDSLEAARKEKLCIKVMLLHYQLGTPEEQEAVCEPTGWRPELPTKKILEM